MTKPKVKFVISVDTEEEWDWSGPFPQNNFSVENIKLVPIFQEFCQKNGLRPTYFVDHAVAVDTESADILRQPLKQQQCEIAAHLHPWCNPPYYGVTGEKESHVVNLPLRVVEEKLRELTECITHSFDVKPRAFRTGRWGISGEVLALLTQYGYDIDSSVYPYYTHKYFSCQGAPLSPYWPSFDNVTKCSDQRKIIEVPVTVGFNWKNFDKANAFYERLSKSSAAKFKAVGLAWYLRLLRKHYLCPELSTAEEMIELIDNLMAQKQPIMHMYLHSSSFLTGVTGFVKSDDPLTTMLERIRGVIEHLKKTADVEFCTISEAANDYMNR